MGTYLISSNLRAKVTIGVVLPLIIILGGFTYIENQRHEETIHSNLSLLASHSGQVIESNLRHAMLKDDFTEVRTLLDTIGNNEEFRVVYVLDTSGEVIFAPHEEGVGTRLDNNEPDCRACHRLPASERPSSIVVEASDGQRVFRSMTPIENSTACSECHDPDQRILGLLLTDISMTPVEAALDTDLRENVLWWIGGILTTVIVTNLVLNQFVLRRLNRFTSAITGLGRGQLPTPLPENQPDEIGQLARAFNLMARKVKTRDVENQQLSASLQRESSQRGELLKRLITAQENERSRVARELHDELGQSLSALAISSEALQSLIEIDPAVARQHLDDMQGLVTSTIDQMYGLILDLRPSALDDLGLSAALRACADRLLQDSDIKFELRADGLNDRLPPVIETTVYRIFQEALNNVVRHAKATQVTISLARRNESFHGEIVDNGIGFDPTTLRTNGQSPRGLGLIGMRERATQVGGRLSLDTKPNQGTRLSVDISIVGDVPGE